MATKDTKVEEQTVVVNGLAYTLSYVPRLKSGGQELWGETNFAVNTIKISTQQSTENQDLTFWHEVGHILYNELIPIVEGNHPDKTEYFCERAAQILHAFMKDNPEFIKDYLLRYTK